jgi:hypothetical protein
MRFFRNRGYRLYFQLLDSFRQSRCPLCILLSEAEQGLVTVLFASLDKKKKRPVSQAALCTAHRRNVKEVARDVTALPLVKTAIGNALKRVSRPSKANSRWGVWLPRPRITCRLCTGLFSEEKILCRALICFLEDADFGKAFQRAPILCLQHLQKCLAVGHKRSGFERLLDDQKAKLNGLLNDLVRFEATGRDPESWSTALAWWADFVGPVPATSGGGAAQVEPAPAAPSGMDFDEAGFNDPDPEKLAFENEKLNRKVRDLLDRLNELETRSASLQYRVGTLTDDNKRLEMGYTGASTQARGLEKLVRELTAEIKTLKEGSRANATGKQQ